MKVPRAIRGGQSFRGRLILAASAAVAVAIAIAAAITFVIVRGELRGQVDDSLKEAAGELAGDQVFFTRPAPTKAPGRHEREVRPPLEGPAEGGLPAVPPEPEVSGVPVPRARRGEVKELVPAPGVERRLVLPAPPLGGNTRFAQLVQSSGRVVRSPQLRIELPGKDRAARLARRGSGAYFSDGEVRGGRVRLYTKALGPGAALQVARPVEELDGVLRRLAWVLGAVALGGIGLAAGLAPLVARTALKPVADLSDAAEHVARTRDLSRRIDASSPDELGRLARSYNAMLAALERSMAQQRQLVADASHELRTPLTSLRTNIEVLASRGGMPAADRERLLRDVVAQLEEMTALVGDLVDLARDRADQEPADELRLDELVANVVERARRRHPERDFLLEAEPTTVRGVPARIDRAVGNLLDNAQKWSPPDAPVEVQVGAGEVVVRDHGPGIADEDLPFVFDRFYRAASARGLPGSGLGLAIVRQVAESHGAGATAENAEGGGARMRLSFQPLPSPPATSPPRSAAPSG
ncbi:MAG TPA: HAMP domain-containing sensor histidine kinase [Thermoleophilaceae bacterium]|nr:HAMP domain-containing sensor histidine kinase [Thermoleophilaceae bacterium]